MELDIQKPECKTSTWLFNPFHYLAGAKALLLGLAVILLTGALAFTGKVHQDGVLDFHLGAPTPFWLFLAEGLLNWAVLSVLLFIAGKLLSKSSLRALDIAGTQALARWPGLVTVAIMCIPSYKQLVLSLLQSISGRATASASGIVIGLTVLIATILSIIWMVALMYRAYAVSCNLKGKKAVLSFIAALLTAETVSKLAIIRIIINQSAN